MKKLDIDEVKAFILAQSPDTKIKENVTGIKRKTDHVCV
jgi:hypothetical protein